METKNVLYELRTKNKMTQDELAEKVFVTRQAVSRWENGETVPNSETLKLLSRIFNVSINTLLGSPQTLICQCCGMPLEDSIISHNADGSLNEDYCKWCYADGTTYLGNQLECEFDKERCFGVLANMDFIMVSTYGAGGENPELILYKKR